MSQAFFSNSPLQRLIVLAAFVGILAISFFWLASSRDELPETDHLASVSPYGCVYDSPLPPAVISSFVDATEEVHLDFLHRVGPLGTYYVPESVGSGGAIGDFDGDGRLDLFLVNSGNSPHAQTTSEAEILARSRLYRMESDGSLSDVSVGSGLEQVGYGMGCAAGDVDNDGDLDLYVTTVNEDRLFLNQGKMKFVDVTEEAGFQKSEWGTGAAFLDFDRDGLLDLVVTNYAEDNKYDFSVACGFHKGLVSYCGPHKFAPTIDRLYRNQGVVKVEPGRLAVPQFDDVTEQSGLASRQTYGFSVTCADFTGDGWVDMYVANDGAPNCLWVNQKDGTFQDEAVLRGVAVNRLGVAEGSMGIAVGDFDGNGALDFVVSHLSSESTTLYLNDGTGHFEDQTQSAGLRESSMRHTGWGTALIDLNHDGILDLPIVNGLVVPCHSGFPFHGEDTFQVRNDVIEDAAAYWRDYHDRNLLLMGRRSGTWQDETVESGGDFTRAAGSGRSLIYGDLDEDGDVDLIVTNSGNAARYYRNDFEKLGHWARFRIFDPDLKRDAIGAEVQVEHGAQKRYGVVMLSSSYLASHDARVHFGLGDVQQIDRVIVRWPDGPVETSREEFRGAFIDRDTTLVRGQGMPVGAFDD